MKIYMLMVLIGAIAAVVIKLPETVTADFVLVPARGTDPVKATRPGIITQVFVSEGQQVNHGDMIATLRSESAGPAAIERCAFLWVSQGGPLPGFSRQLACGVGFCG